MANNSHGMSNEQILADYLNGKKIKDLNLNMKEFIKYIANSENIKISDNTEIKASYEKNNKLKQDFYIEINGIKYGISLKMGSGNSCHQEKIEDFVTYIKTELKADDEICDLWRFFIWADGTWDGKGDLEKDSSGKIICRFNAAKFKKLYPEKRDKLQRFIDDNKEALITRALFVGKHNSRVDYVYHGTYKQGRWISKKEVLNFLVNSKFPRRNACLKAGNLTIQSWNVSLEGKTEHKRGQIQLKYGHMKEDFDAIMKNNADTKGTLFGDMEEFELSQVLNKNKNKDMWSVLLPKVKDYSDYYAVKVSSNQMSFLSGKKVKTKSDVYIIHADIPREFLLQREYVLDENDLSHIKNYSALTGTGISIKMKSSKNYTYQKLTKASFCKAFEKLNDVEFWFLSLLIFSADKERAMNKKLLADFNFTMNSYLQKVNTVMQIEINDTDNKQFWDNVRKKAQKTVKDYVNANKDLAENIFTGKTWFDSPYHADFIYESGVLKKNDVRDFAITTGSGRHKGKYSIIFTPV